MRFLYSIILLLFTLGSFSQEICNNGIDDDGDGLIDLMDEECSCTPVARTSLVPNHDFEDFTSCPNMMAQLYKAPPWMQGTMGNPSYFNRCGFVLPDINNYPSDGFAPNDEPVFFPSGDGIVGVTMSTAYNEYIKATLTTPIPAGAEAQLSIKVAAIIYRNNPPNAYEMEVSDLTPTNLTIYGSPVVSTIPVITSMSPVIPGSTWVELGNAPYDPKAKWQDVTMNFTVPFEIRQIMIGAPDVLPSAYNVPLMHIGSFPYFLYDDVVVNDLTNADMFIKKTGNLCTDDLLLTATLNIPPAGNVVYQWYKDGIPVYIDGRSAVLNVSDGLFPNKNGTYFVKVFDGTNCYEANFTVNSIVPNPRVVMTPPACTTRGTILVTSEGDEYSIDNGVTWSTDPFFDDLLSGTYQVLTRTGGCVSTVRNVNLPARSNNLPPPYILTTQPNSCADIGSIEVVTLNDFYSYDNGVTWTTSNTLQNVPAGDYLVLVKDATGCMSLPVTVTLASFTNNYAPPTGDAIQYFCITENATIQDINVTGSSIKWYDAPTGGNLIPVATPLQDGQTYYASQSVNNCESLTRLQVTAIITTTLNANDYAIQICDEGSDNSEFVNLSDYDSNLTPSTSYFFHYYMSFDGAENQTAADEILNFEDYELTGTTIVYVRVTNQGSCFEVVELTLSLLAPPVIPIKDTVPVCEGSFVAIDAGAGFDSYLWSTNETTRNISVTEPGAYSVTVTKNHGAVTCTTTKDFTVFVSNAATISEVVVSDWNETENTITVVLSPNSVGDYEYSLNGLSFQDSNVFTGLPGGIYTVYVKDKNGCGTIDDSFYVIMFPKFFTPNGDGYNDTWRIQFAQAKDQFTTEIYDRYGKLLKILKSNEVWDGTYDGTPLPSNDYWFKVNGSDGKTLRGHFTLKK